MVARKTTCATDNKKSPLHAEKSVKFEPIELEIAAATEARLLPIPRE